MGGIWEAAGFIACSLLYWETGYSQSGLPLHILSLFNKQGHSILVLFPFCATFITINQFLPFLSCFNSTLICFAQDFRNYQYTLPVVQGLVVDMEVRKTSIKIPSNRYNEVRHYHKGNFFIIENANKSKKCMIACEFYLQLIVSSVYISTCLVRLCKIFLYKNRVINSGLLKWLCHFIFQYCDRFTFLLKSIKLAIRYQWNLWWYCFLFLYSRCFAVLVFFNWK